ncbi:MAG: DUF4402 domain-containing protein [Bacteroidetes bacterium]|nr:DUF4402 domain-containing protein [Bacteroidota bacterium]
MRLIKILMLIYFLIENFAIYGQTTITATANAEIVPLSITTEVSQLNFGKFTPIGGGGNIIITPQGSRVSNGTIILKESAVSPAIFDISDSQNTNFSVIFPKNTVYIYHQNGINAMSLTSWTVDLPTLGSSSEKKNIVKIGCTLNIGSIETNPIGMYSGTYSLTFFYN